jgi:hypothetical protein
MERFRRLSRPATILPHSLWRDEAAIASDARRLRIITRESRGTAPRLSAAHPPASPGSRCFHHFGRHRPPGGNGPPAGCLS